jgi:hypothetical protein
MAWASEMHPSCPPRRKKSPWRRYADDAEEHGVGVVRYPRRTAKDEASAPKLKKRKLTNLYNESPAWLKNAHRRLDEACSPLTAGNRALAMTNCWGDFST